MKKETGDSNAPFLELPEGLNGVKPHAPAHYGKTPLPHPCNERACVVDHAKVMNQVLHAK